MNAEQTELSNTLIGVDFPYVETTGRMQHDFAALEDRTWALEVQSRNRRSKGKESGGI